MSIAIENYYRTIDTGALADATAMLAQDVEFAMVLPGGVTIGHGRAAMLEYLRGRPDVDRRHRLARIAADGDTQFVSGDVTEHGGTVTTGHFVGAMHLDADGLIDRYQVSFTAGFALVSADSRVPSVLSRWFEYMDSDDPDRVLSMITDDFEMSVQFSRGGGAATEFVGDRSALVGYLAQRERSTLVHHLDVGAAVDGHEMVLGRTTRAGAFEASFNAGAQLDAAGRVRRLLIARTPELAFAASQDRSTPPNCPLPQSRSASS